MSQDIRLLELRLNNFKGISEFVLKPNGRDCSIYGDNETGKTTLMDAFTWVLFGKDSLNQSDFELKTINGGEVIHGLEHEVTAKLSPDITLTKRLTEKWTKKRGSAQAVFTGHTADHFVDAVPVQKKEFDRAVSAIADEQLFRLLTNPRYFNEILHWQKRREILMDVCGDVTDEQVIASTPGLQELPAILGKHSMDDYRKILAAKKTEINRELSDIPVRISEVKQGAGDEPVGHKDVAWTLKELESRRIEKQKELYDLKHGEAIAEKTKELREIEAQILSHETNAKQSIQQNVTEKQSELFYIKNQLSDVERKIQNLNTLTDETLKAITRDEKRIEELRTQWATANGSEFTFDSTCPTCKQELPDSMLQEARSNFNQDKARKLAEINSQGKLIKQSIESCRMDLRRIEAEMEASKIEFAGHTKAIQDIQEHIKAIQESPIDLPQDLINHKQTIEDTLKLMSSGVCDTSELEARLSDIESKIDAQKSIIIAHKAWLAAQDRVKELKNKERDLAQEFSQCEKELALCDEFMRRKVSMLTDGINSKFRIARFKLFNENINGGIEPCCELMIDGVPYSSLNNAMRINAGIDVCNTLSEHYGITLPQWVDNAESVVDLACSRGQQIRLVVSGQDEKLRVEIEEVKI